MISGECRVEGIPTADPSLPHRKLNLDGLRLQLDLRIVPNTSGGDAAAAAIWRIVSDGATARSWRTTLAAPAFHRRAAMAAGVAALAFAIGVWFLGDPARSPEAHRSPPARPPDPPASVVAPRITPLPEPRPGQLPAPNAPNSSNSPNVTPPAAPPGSPIQQHDPIPAPMGAAPLPPPPSDSAAPSAIAARSAPPRRGAVARAGAGQESAGTVPSVAAPSLPVPRANPSPQPPLARSGAGRNVVPPASADRDLLDLFGDTK